MKLSKLTNLELMILLAVVSFGVYFNSLEGDFLIDDKPDIVENGRIQDISRFFSEHFRIYIAVLYDLSKVFIWHFWQDNSFYYHLFNVLSHLVCVILLFILGNVLFKHKPLSFLSALIFALHPIHTEAISWISGGHYVFSSLFFILALIFYIKADRSIFNLLLAVFAFILCVLAGNAFATLPLMFIGYDLFFREKTPQSQKMFKVRLIIFFSTVLVAAIFLSRHFIHQDKFRHLIFHFRGYKYLIVAAKAFVYYLKILYLPIRRGLYHPFAFDTTRAQEISPAFFLSLFILSGALISFFKCRHKLKPVSFGIIWFFVAYLPYSNIIPTTNIISERYLYLPSVGFSIIIAALFLKVWELINRNIKYKLALRLIAISAITLFLGSYAILTVKRNYEYNNIVTYWETNIKNFPDGYLVYNNLAGTYYQMGNLKTAIAYCQINLIVNPNQPHVWYNLGNVYKEIGDIKQAKECYENVLKLDKDYFPAYKALEELNKQ